MTIVDKIKEIRQLLGISRKKFASLAGVSPTSIYYYEKGYRTPTDKCLQKILGAFHINPKKFYKDLDAKRENNARRIAVDEKWLRQQYVEKKLTASAIAEKIGHSKSTVLARLKEYQIVRRPKFGRLGPQKPTKYPEVMETLTKNPNEAKKLLALLSRREEEIIGKRLGLEEGRVQTLEQIGRDLGLTRERVRQIQNSALEKLISATERTLINLPDVAVMAKRA